MDRRGPPAAPFAIFHHGQVIDYDWGDRCEGAQSVAELESLLLAGRQPTDPEVLEVRRRLDHLVAREMGRLAADGRLSMVEMEE